MTIEVCSFAERPELVEQVEPITRVAWPEFMHHVPVSHRYWSRMLDYFADYQLMLCKEDVVQAVVNAVPLRVDDDFEHLPDTGFDWGFERSILDHEAGRSPNVMMGVQVVVDPSLQRRGLSAVATGEMVRCAARHGLRHVIVPVRPNRKADFPLIPMDEYVGWKDRNGLPYDGWLRIHVRAGGRVVRTCPEALRISGSVAEWRTWTGQDFPGSGSYVISGGLVPLRIDLHRDEGLYIEPNVWVVHETRDSDKLARQEAGPV